jgi:hypothetical protein
MRNDGCVPIPAATASIADMPRCSWAPTVPAMVVATDAESPIAAKPTNQARPATSPATSAATWTASRVLPTPPGPVRVIRR